MPLGCRLPPPPLHSMIEVGVPGRSPAGQAFLPREQEAEPRPSNLLLEVRGQGRPSRPHFLQPRPTPCGPRVYGNSGLDGFSEIIRSLCPYLTPRAQRGTRAGVLGSMGREGSPSQRAQICPQSQHFLFKLGFYGSGSGFAFHLHNDFFRGGGLDILHSGENPGSEGPCDHVLRTQLARTTTQFATLASLALDALLAAGLLHTKYLGSWYKMWVQDARATVARPRSISRQWWVRKQVSSKWT